MSLSRTPVISIASLVCREVLRRGRGKNVFYADKPVAGKPVVPDLPLKDPTTGWTFRDKRVGAIGVKLGMTQDWNEYGKLIPLTVVHLPENQITQVKTKKTDGFYALQVGAGQDRLKHLTRSMMGHLAKAGVDPKKTIAEFSVTKGAIIPIGTPIYVRHFTPGQIVDVAGTTKGKGFQGGMKRWGFAGQPASHGVSVSHRSIGATGNRQDPGKVFKGKKMPGRMGGERRTVQGVWVHKIDNENQVIYLRGQVPGHKGGWLFLKDGFHNRFKEPPPFPTYIPKEGEELPKTMVAAYPNPYDQTVQDVTQQRKLRQEDEEKRFSKLMRMRM